MVNNNKSKRFSVAIDSVIEVRICAEMWDRIKWVANERGVSYSWVVRYAVFRMIKRVDPKRLLAHVGNPRLAPPSGGGSLNERAWVRRAGASIVGVGGKHRHRLCLYGGDEAAIRHAAAYYGCTMTHLIRVALELHFERLFTSMLKVAGGPDVASGMSYFQRAFWFWLGIKVCKGVEFHTFTYLKKLLEFHPYRRSEYFGRDRPLPRINR